jgi:hypothetical protein
MGTPQTTRLFPHLPVRPRLRRPRLLLPHKQALQGALFARHVAVLYLTPVCQIPTPTLSSISAIINVVRLVQEGSYHCSIFQIPFPRASSISNVVVHFLKMIGVCVIDTVVGNDKTRI